MHTITLKAARPPHETKAEAPGDAITRQVDALFAEFATLKQRIDDATNAGLDSGDVAEVRDIIASMRLLRAEAEAFPDRFVRLREEFWAERDRLADDIEVWETYNDDRLTEMSDAGEFTVDIDHYIGEFERWIAEMEADDEAPEPKSRRGARGVKRTALPPPDDAPSILPLVTDLVDTLAAAGDDPETLDAVEAEARRLGETDIRDDPAADEIEPLLLDLLAEISRRRQHVAA